LATEDRSVPVSLRLRYRDGAHEIVTDAAEVDDKIRRLVDDLCDEPFARPDYEHSAVSVSHPNGWYIEANMNGELQLAHWPMGVAPNRYQYGLSKDDLVRLFIMLTEGRMEAIHAMKWHDDPVHGDGDHYLFLNRPEMTDLHRAAAKGDCEWIRSELAAGAEIDVKDGEGMTPLHWAALTGHIEACCLLMKEGADVNRKNSGGGDAISCAKLSGEYIGSVEAQKLVKALIDGGAGS
jgi:Ankyrin repeats (many copies)